MSRLSGTVTLSGSAVSGATVYVIDTDSNSIVATEMTDANGDWEATGLVDSASERYHALVQYDDGSTKYNAESLPYLSTPGLIEPGAVNVNVDSPTPSISATGVATTGLLHDYNALDLSASDGNAISTFPDSFGANDLTGNATYRASSINGNPALEFDAVDDNFSGDAFVHGDSGAEFTAHMVYVWASSSDQNTVLSSGGGDDGVNYVIRGDQSDERQIGVTGIGSTTDGTATTSPEVVSVRRSSTNAIEMRVNGSDVSLSSINTPDQATGTGYIGSFDGSSRLWNNYIGRVLWYDSRQSDSDYSDTHSTLRNEWGV